MFLLFTYWAFGSVAFGCGLWATNAVYGQNVINIVFIGGKFICGNILAKGPKVAVIFSNGSLWEDKLSFQMQRAIDL